MYYSYIVVAFLKFNGILKIIEREGFKKAKKQNGKFAEAFGNL